jgi:signal transduction histidine kinase
MGRPRSLRRRVRASIVGIAALTVALFAVPLGWAVQVGYRNDAVNSLQRESTRVAATMSDSFGSDGSTITLPADLASGLTVGIYRTDGTRIAYQGPDRSPVASAVADGHLHNRLENAALAVAAPVPSDGRVTLAVRVAQPAAALHLRVARAWALMALLGAIVIGLAALLARREARLIAAPLEQLTTSAQALGDGNFAVRVAGCGIAEADAAGAALQATAQRLGDVLSRERAFSAEVSHQLRTPLTALLLSLESALARPGDDAGLRAAAERAVQRAEQLRATIEDLVGLARGRRGDSPLDIEQLLTGLRERWHAALAAQGRRLTLSSSADLPKAVARAAAARQILDVLVDNALVHGAGTVSVTVVDTGTALAIEVGDEGPELAIDPFAADAHGGGHGIGLTLARSLAHAENSRLVLRRPGPHPVFSLLLPVRTGTPDPAPS